MMRKDKFINHRYMVGVTLMHEDGRRLGFMPIFTYGVKLLTLNNVL